MLAHIRPSLQKFTRKARPSFNGVVTSGPVSRTLQGPPRVQSPFARLRRYLSRRDLFRISSEGATPPSSLLRTHAPDPIPPNVFAFPYSPGLRRLSPVPAGRWPFPMLSLRSFPRSLDPYPAMPLWCSYPFLPRRFQPQPRCTHFGASSQWTGSHLPELWYHYMTETDNYHDGSFTRWIAALSAAPCNVKVNSPLFCQKARGQRCKSTLSSKGYGNRRTG